MNPAPIERCRVLELGSASGGNIIPMAAALPDSEFIGIDLSARQVASGQGIIEELGLKNIRLEHRSITDVGLDYGQFDYVIAHGVYSWVPSEVQDKILLICKKNLAPQGVAYVSYNTLPGWHIRGMIRDMMLYHSSRFGDEKEKVAQARALVDFLVKSVPNEKSTYAQWLKEELEVIQKSADYYIFHEHLEQINVALYFHQFMALAGSKGLQYLGEAEFHTMLGTSVPAKTNETLRKLFPDSINYEQYLDFVRNRMFRQTLLTHSNVPLKRDVDGSKLYDLFPASGVSPVSSSPHIISVKKESFKTPGGVTFDTDRPIIKAALGTLLKAWPQQVSFENLFTAALGQLYAGVSIDEARKSQERIFLGSDFLRLYAWGAIELHCAPPAFTMVPPEFPEVSPLARAQARRGLLVTNFRHEPVMLDEPLRQVAMLLDGSRDSESVLASVEKLIEAGILTSQKDGAPVEADKVRPQLALLIQGLIQNLGRLSLLKA